MTLTGGDREPSFSILLFEVLFISTTIRDVEFRSKCEVVRIAKKHYHKCDSVVFGDCEPPF